MHELPEEKNGHDDKEELCFILARKVWRVVVRLRADHLWPIVLLIGAFLIAYLILKDIWKK